MIIHLEKGTNMKYEISGSAASGLLHKFLFIKNPGLISLVFFSLSLTILNYAQEEKIFNDNPAQINSNNSTIVSDLADTLQKSDTTISTGNDLSSLSLAFKPKLLPDNMSFTEKFLWDENGFMRKIGIAGPLTAESRKDEIQARRTMLSIHQIAGVTTLGLMIASAYYGQKVIDGRRNFSGTHQTLVTFTIGTYALTGLLAILSPPPLIRRGDEESTTSIHKTLAWVHLAGMIITPIIGSMISQRHHVLNMDKAHFHQVLGYITTATFATSIIVLFF
jgi:hypothetical protein